MGREPDEQDNRPEPDRQDGGVVGWVLFVLITLLCGLAIYIQCSGVRQL